MCLTRTNRLCSNKIPSYQPTRMLLELITLTMISESISTPTFRYSRSQAISSLDFTPHGSNPTDVEIPVLRIKPPRHCLLCLPWWGHQMLALNKIQGKIDEWIYIEICEQSKFISDSYIFFYYLMDPYNRNLIDSCSPQAPISSSYDAVSVDCHRSLHYCYTASKRTVEKYS